MIIQAITGLVRTIALLQLLEHLLFAHERDPESVTSLRGVTLPTARESRDRNRSNARELDAPLASAAELATVW
jgi:hypothetical protein